MKNKIFAVTAVLVVIGIIIVAIKGFNVDFCYKQHSLIYIELGQDFNSNDIKAITNEVFSKQKVEIQSSGSYKDNLVINVESVTDEQKEALKQELLEELSKK